MLQLREKTFVARFLFSVTFLVISLNSFPVIDGKQFLRCELARELLNHQFSKTFLSNCE